MSFSDSSHIAPPSFSDELALGQIPRADDKSKERRPRVVVTGGSGKLGRAVVRDLAEHGWDVINFDRVPSRDVDSGAFYHVNVELTDMGQVMEALHGIDMIYRGVDAVVHLAALCNPGQAPSSTLFQTNVLSTYNVLEACRKQGIKKIVLASSETLIGIPLRPHPPIELPITEESESRPESAYSLSKLVGEEIAKQYARWDPSTKIISLRFSYVTGPEDYSKFRSWQKEPLERFFNVWGYIDARDGAQAVRLSLTAPKTGHHVYLIAAADTCMEMPSEELVKGVFPDVPYKATAGLNDTLLSIAKAGDELGYLPAHSWRTQV